MDALILLIWFLVSISWKTAKNGHNMHQNGNIWSILAIFLAGTSCPLSGRCGYFPHLINWCGFSCPKFTQTFKNGHSRSYYCHFYPFFVFFFLCAIKVRTHLFCSFVIVTKGFRSQYPEKQQKMAIIGTKMAIFGPLWPFL